MTGQTVFRAALLDAALPVPEGLTDAKGRPAGRRYAVYRNNVAVSLREALATGFPAVARLIGTENFNHVAGVFLRRSPPSSPLMMHYGDGFPAFLAAFKPLAHIGYLPDVARLELAQRRAYHAADSTAIDPASLVGLDEDRLMAARLTLAPAVQLLRSDWPVLSVYRYTMDPNQPKPQARAEDLVILRPDYDPELHLLPPGGAGFVAALTEGQTFGQALDKTPEDFDLPTTLSLLLSGKALTSLTL